MLVPYFDRIVTLARHDAATNSCLSEHVINKSRRCDVRRHACSLITGIIDRGEKANSELKPEDAVIGRGSHPGNGCR